MYTNKTICSVRDKSFQSAAVSQSLHSVTAELPSRCPDLYILHSLRIPLVPGPVQWSLDLHSLGNRTRKAVISQNFPGLYCFLLRGMQADWELTLLQTAATPRDICEVPRKCSMEMNCCKSFPHLSQWASHTLELLVEQLLWPWVEGTCCRDTLCPWPQHHLLLTSTRRRHDHTGSFT